MSPGIDLQQLNIVQQRVLSRSSLARIVEQYNLYPVERARDPLEEIVAGMRRRSIQIRVPQTAVPRQTTKAFTVAFDYRDPKQAQAVANDLTAQFAASMPVEVLDPASLPRNSFTPNRPVWLLAGLVLGGIAAMVLIGIRRWPLVALAGLISTFVVWPATYWIPNEYRSNAVVRSVRPARYWPTMRTCALSFSITSSISRSARRCRSQKSRHSCAANFE